MSNALRSYVESNPNAEMETRTRLERAADRLFNSICETYEYDGIQRDSRYVSPAPNHMCGINVSTGLGRITLFGTVGRGRGDEARERVSALFRRVPISMSEAQYGGIHVGIEIPVDWESNADALHDVAALCNHVFYRRR